MPSQVRLLTENNATLCLLNTPWIPYRKWKQPLYNYRYSSDVDHICSCFNRFCGCYKHPNHPRTIAEELLWKLLQPLHRKIRERKPLCAHSISGCHHTAVWCLVFTHCLHSSSGISWNHHQVVGLSDHFRKREGVQQRGGVKTAFVWRKVTSHCCLLGGVIFPDRVQRPGHIYFFEDAEAVSYSSPKLYRLPLLLCNYVSLLTSHLSIGFFNPWNELLVLTQTSDIEVYPELSWWAISFQLQHRVIFSKHFTFPVQMHIPLMNWCFTTRMWRRWINTITVSHRAADCENAITVHRYLCSFPTGGMSFC